MPLANLPQVCGAQTLTNHKILCGLRNSKNRTAPAASDELIVMCDFQQIEMSFVKPTILL